ncbi:MAG: Nucleotidyl transferase [Ignavibacteria bacterium]|nr:Nucleotidyl transferase [Ignavibacteria bacterium]
MEEAVIMAGGFGTRLRPLTMDIPKPMVPILNVPMMEHIVNLLKNHNITKIVSVLYFHPDIITTYFEDGSRFGVDMKYVQAQADYGTAGAVRNAYEYLKSRFIVISGDVLTDFDITKALEFHKEKNSAATILLTRVPDPLQFGIVMTDSDGRITRFLEKPSWGQVFSDTINTGIYILDASVLDLIPYQEEFDFSKDLFPLMLRLKMPLYGYITSGYWRDIGNLNEYQAGQLDALHGKVKLNMDISKKENHFIGRNSTIASTTKLHNTVLIGNDTKIGNHCEITDSVIGSNVVIGNGVRLTGVTLWDQTQIGDLAELTDDVIGKQCNIGMKATIEENVFIADQCSIGDKAHLSANIKLWPQKHIADGATLSRSLVQEETWQKELFTDARISGISNIEIHPEFGAKLGSAIGMAFEKNSSFLASRDPDKVSRIMKRSITSGLSTVGINVNDLQIISIPQTRQELRTGRYAGGIHVRRSPRNPQNIDIIIFNKEGRDIQTSRAKTIERYFFGEEIKRVSAENVGNINYPERTSEIYTNRFLETLETVAILERRYKILIDYSFGLASTIFPQILGNLRTDVLSLNNYVDASRFKSEPNVEEHPDDNCAKIMRSLGYELGFWMEPGAEKIALIDERGVWYSSMRLLSIVTKLFLETNRHREPYKIAVSIAASKEIEIIAKNYNVNVERIKNSHSAMMEATRPNDVLFVGGVYGGFIFSDFLFASDGMYSVGKILEMLALTKMKISEIDAMLPRRVQHFIEVPCPWDYKGTIMRRAMEHTDQFERQLVDGIKIFAGLDSVLLLPAKEKGAFSIIGESEVYENAVFIAESYNTLIRTWLDEP